MNLMTMSTLPRTAGGRAIQRLVRGGASMAVFALATAASLTSAAAQALPARAEVRFQPASSQLGLGWQAGTLYSAPGDCAMVITADPTVRGGRRVLHLAGIEKLQRKDGATWVDVPVKAVRAKEPRRCGEAVGG